ncbi:acetate uptake transporter [Candidatus Roizmanbacteria bacterium]|nr:acetate uptake transporter [Candidatus Roizmanbacteria bacterium]
MPHETEIVIKDDSSNPAPLGLLGFGMTTVLLNLHNVGLYDMNSMILAMGLFYGGVAQIIAGGMEWKKGNTFGTTAFLSYGLFWLTLVGLLVLPKLGLAQAADPLSMGWYLLMWGILTVCFFVGTLRLNFALQFVFGTLTILFFLLALGDFTGNEMFTVYAGYEGVLCGSSAIYTAIAQVLNEVYGKTILPVWPVKK